MQVSHNESSYNTDCAQCVPVDEINTFVLCIDISCAFALVESANDAKTGGKKAFWEKSTPH